jgi:signal transduction histidine kinase/ActR/RegA family two-component response regulator
MMKNNKGADQMYRETIFLLTSSHHDSAVVIEVLKGVGISATACRDLADLCEQLNHDLGAVILSDDAISPDGIFVLQAALNTQGPWSDVPMMLLTSSGVAHANELFSKIGNVSLLERPFSRLTLIRAVEVALRARKRQYEVRNLLAALQRSKDEAERANIAKTEFLANVSHEIRTPMGAILGFLDLMKNPMNDPQENRNYMGVVERNSQQLLRLIDDILDLSKVEAGKMTVERMQFCLTDILVDLSSTMAFRAGEKGIGFELKINGLIPDQIVADPVRLRQILGNIVGNAIKFTQKGQVQVTVGFSDPFLLFTVKDTGLGISPAQETKLFQPFSQADTSTTRKFGGTGLGLVLSKRLAELLGGSLTLAESKVGIGSIFSVKIRPLLVPTARMVGKEALIYSGSSREHMTSENILGGLSVLLVEDSPDNQVLISTYLRKLGADVKTACDGLQGLDIATQENFDVVLMDVQMPRMDGHEATRALRSQHYGKPIVALTAHAMNEERSRCFESGFTDFLTKPVQREQLLNVLTRYVPRTLN